MAFSERSLDDYVDRSAGMKIICEQEEGYARTVEVWHSAVKIKLHITESEARQFVAAIAHGFGNLVTSDHIWTPILEAAS